MKDEVEPEITLSERDLRALAMELALQLPRNTREAEYVMRLMRVGYDYFLSEPVAEASNDERVVRPKFAR